MQKAASMSSALVLIFPSAVLVFGLPTRKICLFRHPAQVAVCEINTAVLIFDVWVWRHSISPASVDVCMISTELLFVGLCTAVLIFGLYLHKISTAS